MYGIEKIGVYIPDNWKDNICNLEKFDLDNDFLIDKIGVVSKSVKFPNENTSDLCVKAFQDLSNKTDLNIDDIDVVILVTQNPDQLIPHTSSVIHKELNLKKSCACFDISLGCSGFVYGLSVITSFMNSNSFKKGLLFTADPYSKIVNEDDKNTSLLFGDAATVSLISENFTYCPLKYLFGTYGEKGNSLTIKDDKLFMDGRSIYNFTSIEVPKNIKDTLALNELDIDGIDFFALHPGSKYILKTLIRKLKIPHQKIDGNIEKLGNTVSSSIPIELAKKFDKQFNQILISGFGVGLSWATTILRRK